MGAGLSGCGEGGIVRGDIAGRRVVREFELSVLDVSLLHMLTGCSCRLSKQRKSPSVSSLTNGFIVERTSFTKLPPNFLFKVLINLLLLLF